MLEILIETLIENFKLFPFLFITYLLLEYLEHKTTYKNIGFIRKANKSGPLISSILGAIPQCGFSAVAANLYAVRIVTLGTLIAIFLSTSDETIPIMISNGVSPILIMQIIGFKIVCGIFFGYLIDFFAKSSISENYELSHIKNLCKSECCNCEKGIVKSALIHSINITLFIFIISLFLNILINRFTHIGLIIYFLQIPILGEVISGLVGLIPNCSASVILTQLYLDGYINLSTLLSGSFVNGGVGILVLFRTNENIKQNIYIVFMLYCCGVLGGLISNLLG
jgi:hypothetical protein